MNILKKLIGFIIKNRSGVTPILIIKKDTEDINVKEYKSIEEAIIDLENDPNVPFDKIEKLRSSLENLKNRSSIKIRNGELIK